tara:strand:- start:55028 stop:55540 length:513 start_codon:yes stop_codon:yes gene_type:complete
MQELLYKFDTVTQELCRLLQPLDEAELNRAPFKDSWTAGQVGDHLYRSYEVSAILNGNVEPTQRPADQKLREVENLFLDFTVKMESPREILPSKSPIDKDSLLSSLQRRIAEQRDVILHKDLSMTCLDYAIPGYGPFTRWEWIGFNIVHTQRHLHQLGNVIGALKNQSSQ